MSGYVGKESWRLLEKFFFLALHCIGNWNMVKVQCAIAWVGVIYAEISWVNTQSSWNKSCIVRVLPKGSNAWWHYCSSESALFEKRKMGKFPENWCSSAEFKTKICSSLLFLPLHCCLVFSRALRHCGICKTLKTYWRFDLKVNEAHNKMAIQWQIPTFIPSKKLVKN